MFLQLFQLSKRNTKFLTHTLMVFYFYPLYVQFKKMTLYLILYSGGVFTLCLVVLFSFQNGDFTHYIIT